MEAKLNYDILKKLINEYKGLNIYELRNTLEKEFKINVSYSTIHKYISFMEKDGLITIKLVPKGFVKKIYLKEDGKNKN